MSDRTYSTADVTAMVAECRQNINAAYARGYRDALAEARDAVAALRPDKWEGYAATQAALAAIDALKEQA